MKKKILIVDDDPDIRKTLGLIFSKEYEFLEAADGLAGVEVMGKAQPHLVLLDISMPRMSGLEVVKLALSQHPHLRIVMITAEMDLNTAKTALDFGAIAYITKPFDLDYLVTEVRRLMETPPSNDKKDDYRPWRIAS